MPTMFVSFRNGDEPYAAALIYQALARRFGRDSVFRSSDSIAPGVDWAHEIWESHRRSDVLIVVVGPRWLDATDDHGRRRLALRDDWVRAEIDHALRDGKHIIPVLLAGTPRFKPKQLPRSIARLAAYQSVSIDHRNADAALERIVAAISRLTGTDPAGDRLVDPADHWLGVWNLPRRMPHFVERESLMRSLRCDLVAARGMGPVVVHGGVGTGKTQLAIEYAYRFAGDYQLAWWVSGVRPELLWTQLAALGPAVGLDLDSGSEAALPRLVRELHRRGRWLLIVDGVDDPWPLADPLATLGAGADVLVVSRTDDWGMLPAAYLPVGVFERSQAVALLETRLPGEDRPALERLAQAVDDVPLAVAQAATFLPRSTITVDQYLDLLRTRTRELLDRGDTYVYPRSLAAAWSVGLDRLRVVSPGGVALLELLSVFAPAPVPLDLPDPTPPGPPAALAELAELADPIQRADAARAVAASGLVPMGSGRPHPHALLQTFVRSGLAAERVDTLREAARWLLAHVPRPDPREPASWERYLLLVPHVVALDLADSPDRASHRLLLDTIHHLVVRGDAATARDLAASARSRWEQAYGQDAPSVLDAMSRLAQAYFRLRDHRAALALDEEVLIRRRRLAGDDDPRTLEAAHNVAMERLAVDGSDPTVRRELAEVVARRTRVLGADHPDTLRSVHNLALAHRAEGDLEQALALDEQTHRRLVDTLGADHPDTLRSAHAVALDQRALGRTDRSREREADTFQRRRRVLGADHPDTLRSGYALAVDLRSAAALDEAQDLAAETHRRRSRVQGADHPDTLRSAYLLGLVMQDRGDPAAAQVQQEAAAALRELASRTPARSPIG